MRRRYLLARRRQVDADLAEELETIAAWRRNASSSRGCRRPKRRHASRRTLGNVTLAREEARSVWVWPWLDSVRKDIAYAASHPAPESGLLGRCRSSSRRSASRATTSVFGLVDALILKPLPVRNPDRLVYFSSPASPIRIFQKTRQRGGGHLLQLLRVEPRVRQHRLERTARAGGSPDGLGGLLFDARHRGRYRPDLYRRGRSARAVVRTDWWRSSATRAGNCASTVTARRSAGPSASITGRSRSSGSRRVASSAWRPGWRRTSPSR